MFRGCDLGGADVSGARLQGATFAACRFEGLQGVGGLRGAKLGWADLMELAGVLAAEIGIEVLDDEEDDA